MMIVLRWHIPAFRFDETPIGLTQSNTYRFDEVKHLKPL
jgi:hypothetical protein